MFRGTGAHKGTRGGVDGKGGRPKMTAAMRVLLFGRCTAADRGGIGIDGLVCWKNGSLAMLASLGPSFTSPGHWHAGFSGQRRINQSIFRITPYQVTKAAPRQRD